MEYKQLTKEEVKDLYKKLKGHFEVEDYSELIELVNKYFVGAKSLLIQMESEYDDQYYNHRVQAVFVYGEGDVEVSISRDQRREFLEEIERISIGAPRNEEDPIDDVVLYINQELPEIYMEVK